jgi:hypothetical protein
LSWRLGCPCGCACPSMELDSRPSFLIVSRIGAQKGANYKSKYHLLRVSIIGIRIPAPKTANPVKDKYK